MKAAVTGGTGFIGGKPMVQLSSVGRRAAFSFFYSGEH